MFIVTEYAALSITYNGCEFGLLIPLAILALPKCPFKGWRL